MIDQYGRTIDYLRLSVTDLCNYRCQYCMPADGVEKGPHGAVLSVEEYGEIARAAVKLGIRKIRLTGGEPLVRRGILDICRTLRAIPELKELCLTTNGSLLPELAKPLREAGVDGWRLDVGDEISHEFWRSFRKAIKAEFPQALIVGEIWHHAPDFLQGDQWDSVMNYPFYRSVLDFAATGSIPASALLDALGFQRGNIHTCAYPLLWNLLGSHDTARLLYLCGENRQKQKLAAKKKRGGAKVC